MRALTTQRTKKHWTIYSWNDFGGASKHEDVYLKGYATMPEVHLGLMEYFVFYNTERTHQIIGLQDT